MGDVATLETWKNKLVRRKNGEPYPDERNIKIALEHAPELKRLFRYDEFSDHVELTRPPPGIRRDELNELFDDDEPISLADEHVTALLVYLAQQGFTSLRFHVLQDTIVLVAKGTPVHPVRDYLEMCVREWDGEARLDQWLKTYLGARDDADYLKDVGSKFMVGAVARIFEPGCQMDSILVLEGEQGEGKSQAVRTLGCEWTADLSGDLADKDAAIALQRVWIAELAELTALRRSEQEPIKAFISRRVDHYRPPYGRNTVTRPRHTVFIATTNESDYLQDPTGARRYWPVDCRAIDLAALKRDRAQLWGEAVSRYRGKEAWHLDRVQVTRAKQEQAARQRLSPADEVVLEYADRLFDAGQHRIDMRQLLREVFNITAGEDPGRAGGIAAIASRALTHDGWKRLKPTGRGKNRVQAYEKWTPHKVPPQPSQGDLTPMSPAHSASQGSQGSQGTSEDSRESKSQGSQGSQGGYEGSDDEIPF